MLENPLVNLRIREDADLAYSIPRGTEIEFSSDNGVWRIREIQYSLHNYHGLELRDGSTTPLRIIGRSREEISDLIIALMLKPNVAHGIASTPGYQGQTMSLYGLMAQYPSLFDKPLRKGPSPVLITSAVLV
ncbi:hypothetical protein KY360_06340 [Candidatus Woesearchaeota archaeon]|nr:hypothetical protein [Candidatus Woesearchaeota archaeon]